MVPIVRPCAVLAVGLALGLALPAAAGTVEPGAQTRRTPPVAQIEEVTVTVSPGLLLVSVAAPRRFRDDGRVHRTEPLEVVVRDARPGSPGWSLGGIARGFSEQDGPGRAGEAVRWTPRLVAAPQGSTIRVTASGLGEAIEPDPGAAARQLASGEPGKSFGTAVIAVTLGVPLTSREALFTGDVTFTVL